MFCFRRQRTLRVSCDGGAVRRVTAQPDIRYAGSSGRIAKFRACLGICGRPRGERLIENGATRRYQLPFILPTIIDNSPASSRDRRKTMPNTEAQKLPEKRAQ